VDPLGLGLIGFGGFGRFCLEAFESLPEVRLVAVAETDPQRRLKADLLGHPTVTHAEDLLVIPEVDIVHICTPPHTHAPLSIAATRSGKHVFCEKPLAMSVSEATEMIAAAQANGVQIMVNYVLRYNPLVQRVRALLDQQILGKLHHLSLENWATDEPLYPEHWFWKQELSGGIWIEHGVHFFDLFRMLTGKVSESVASTDQMRPDGCLNRVWALVRYTDGLVASFHHAFTQPARIEQTTINLTGTRGYATLYGWIPTRLVVEVLLDEAGLQTFREWEGHDPIILETYIGDQIQGWASGEPYRAVYRIRTEVELSDGKLEVYRYSIRSAMADLIRSIYDQDYLPAITVEDMLLSLAVAQTATTAAQSRKWEKVPIVGQTSG
jgi:predicted dehydrogenase